MATLEQKIMRRVWAIYLTRKVTSYTALRIYTLVFLAFESRALFNVRDIFANMPSIVDVSRLFYFYSAAFLHTDVLAQVVLAAIIAIGGFSAWRTVQYLSRTLRPSAIVRYV